MPRVKASLPDRPSTLNLELELKLNPEYPNSAYLELEPELAAKLGGKGRIPVKLSVGGHVFRSSLAPMGGTHMMVFNRQMRDATGLKAGDRINAVLERDDEPRLVETPDDVRSALEQAGVWQAFQSQSYSHQKEHVDWICEAKKPETRERRISKLAVYLSTETKSR